MKLLITGARGQLGTALSLLAKEQDVALLEGDLPHLDITDSVTTEKAVRSFQPDIIVNAAAYTQVDQAEIDGEKAFLINRDGPLILSDICSRNRLPLIHISTDYVFDGNKASAYLETDPVSPIGVYGKSKEEGETEVRKRLFSHVIIRTSWLYGLHGGNFVKTMLRLGKEKETLRVVMDQKGCPTCAEDLAEAILHVCRKSLVSGFGHWGTYHYCNAGILSWYEFARTIIEMAARYGAVLTVKEIRPIETAEYPTRVTRPPFSALNCDKIVKNFGIGQKPWKESLDRTLKKLLSPETSRHEEGDQGNVR